MNQFSWCGIEITPEMLARAVSHRKRMVLIDNKAHLLADQKEKPELETSDELPEEEEDV